MLTQNKLPVLFKDLVKVLRKLFKNLQNLHHFHSQNIYKTSLENLCETKTLRFHNFQGAKCPSWVATVSMILPRITEKMNVQHGGTFINNAYFN